MNLLPTQIIEDEDYAPTQPIFQPSPRHEREQVGILKIDSDSYPIYKGINKIGRHPGSAVVINNNTISKEHAEIEVGNGAGSTFICDLGSSNKTRINNMVLRSGRYYQLKDGDSIAFGQVTATYRIVDLLSNMVIPETPAPKQVKQPQLVIPSTPDSSLNASSDADLSRVTDPRHESEDSRLSSSPQQHCKRQICLTSDASTFEKGSFTDDNINTNNSDPASSSVKDESSVSKEKESNDLSIFEMDTQKYSMDHVQTTNIHVKNTQEYTSNEDTSKEEKSTCMTHTNVEISINEVIPKTDDKDVVSPRTEMVNSESSMRERSNESLSSSPTNLYIDVDEHDEDRNSELDVNVDHLGSQNLLDECVAGANDAVTNDTNTLGSRKSPILDQALEDDVTTRESSSTVSQNIFDAPTQRITETKSKPRLLSPVRSESSSVNDDSETDEDGIFEELASKKNATVEPDDTAKGRKSEAFDQKSFKANSDSNLGSNSVSSDALAQKINAERDTREMENVDSLRAEEKRNSRESIDDDIDDNVEGDIEMSLAPTQIVYGNLVTRDHARNDSAGMVNSERVAATKDSGSTDADEISDVACTQILDRNVNSLSSINIMEMAPTQLLLEDEESKEETIFISHIKDVDYDLAPTQLIDVNEGREVPAETIVDREKTSAAELPRVNRSMDLDQALERKNIFHAPKSAVNENIFDAPTQLISEINSDARTSSNRNTYVANDSIERKLNTIFEDDVYEGEDINDITSMSTQNVQRILESSQTDRSESTSDTINKSAFDDQNCPKVIEESSKLAHAIKDSSRQDVLSLSPIQVANTLESDETSVTNCNSRSIEGSANSKRRSIDLQKDTLGFVDGKAVDSDLNVSSYEAPLKKKTNLKSSNKITTSSSSNADLDSKVVKVLDEDNTSSEGNDFDRTRKSRTSSRRSILQTSKAMNNVVDDDSSGVEWYFSNYVSKRKRDIIVESDSRSAASISETLDFTKEKSVPTCETLLEKKEDSGNKSVVQLENVDTGTSGEPLQPISDDKTISKESDFDPLKLDTQEFLDGFPPVQIAGTISYPANSLVQPKLSSNDIGKSIKRPVKSATRKSAKKFVKSEENLLPKSEECEKEESYCGIKAEIPSSSKSSDVIVAKFDGVKKEKELDDFDNDLEYKNLKKTADTLLCMKSGYSYGKSISTIDAVDEIDSKKDNTISRTCNLHFHEADDDNPAKSRVGNKMVTWSDKADDVDSSVLRVTKLPLPDTAEKSVRKTVRTKSQKIVSHEKRFLNLEGKDDGVVRKKRKEANVEVKKEETDTSIVFPITIEKDSIESTADVEGNNSRKLLRNSKKISTRTNSKETSSVTEEDTRDMIKAKVKPNALKRSSRRRLQQSPTDNETESIVVRDGNTNKEVTRDKVVDPSAINSNSEPGLESQEVEQILFNAVNAKNKDEDVRLVEEKRRKKNTKNGRKCSSSGVSAAESSELNCEVFNEVPVKKSRKVKVMQAPVIEVASIERPKKSKIPETWSCDSQCRREDAPINDKNKTSEDSSATSTKKFESLRPKRSGTRGKCKSTEKDETYKSNRSTSSSTDSELHDAKIVTSTPIRTRNLSSSCLTPSSLFRMKPKILFTGVKEEEFKDILLKLGGIVTDKPTNCTVLVTDKIRRTFKFLCAMALAVPVVSVHWLTESGRKGHFLNMETYILNDPTEEAKFGFKLQKSLEKAGKKKMLEGYTILLTPNVAPPAIAEIKSMIQACGGKVILRPPTTWHENTVVVSRVEDVANAKRFTSKAPKTVPLLTTEFILTGILRQELDFVAHKLTIK